MNSFPDFKEAYEEIPADSRDFFSPAKTFMRKIIKLIGFFACLSVLVSFSMISYDFIRTRKAFPPQTFIGNIEVSNLNQEEAMAKLKSFPLSQIYTPLITLESDAQRFSNPPENLGIFLLINESVSHAFTLTHKDNYFDNIKERITKGVTLAPLILGINEKELETVLQEIAREISSSPRDSSVILYEDTGGYHIEPEELGREVDIKKSISVFISSIYKGRTTISLAIEFEYPKIREKELRTHPPVYRLSAYTTYYGKHDSPNRIHNIKLVASWVDGTLLMPGDLFSVAETLGDITPERGFKEAFVIAGGELVPLLGGGSCQIATTLYNTVALADLKVLQRRNHSFYFNIYPLGRDAGVYPGQLDFKFENDTPYPILIKSVATNRRLSFRIYGTPTGKKVEFSPTAIYSFSQSGHYAPVSLQTVIARDIPFKTVTVRTVYDKDGNKIKEETIESFYKLYGEKSNVPIRRPEPR